MHEGQLKQQYGEERIVREFSCTEMKLKEGRIKKNYKRLNMHEGQMKQ
jgi:hypothetical protein